LNDSTLVVQLDSFKRQVSNAATINFLSNKQRLSRNRDLYLCSRRLIPEGYKDARCHLDENHLLPTAAQRKVELG